MYYPNLRLALDRYCASLLSTFKSSVQVKTGALRDSIKVSCTVNDTEYSLTVSLNDYWKYLPQPFPWDDAFQVIGVPRSFHTSFPQSTGYQRYQFNPEQWKVILSDALEKDIRQFLNS